MGMIQKKSRTTGKRPRRTGEKVAQNTGTDFLALGVKGGSLPSNSGPGVQEVSGTVSEESPESQKHSLEAPETLWGLLM